MARHAFDLVVIGAGPGGYVAAIRAAQLGLRTACVERERDLGGTCLRIGCIPSKALLESSERYDEARHGLARHGVKVEGVALDLAAMMRHKESTVKALTGGVGLLLRKNGVRLFSGEGRLRSPGLVEVRAAGEDGAAQEEIEAKHVLLATGSLPAGLPGVAFDGERVVTSTEALAFDEVPEHLVVIGAGAIGLELGSVWRRLGARVTVLEWLDRILPGMDRELAGEAQKLFAKQGLEFRLGARVTGARAAQRGPGGAACAVECEGAEPLVCDRVLVAVGRRPCTDGLGLAELGLALDDRGRVPVDANYATRVAGLYAVGDLIAGPMLAHKASEEGIACVERIAGGYGHVNYDAVPNIVYTHPEAASVGRSEEELAAAGVAFRKGSFPFRANGRARALADTEGFVKLLADARTDRLLGAHILGPRAGDLIAELAVAIEFGASAEDLARSAHAHPTLAECVKEAALAVAGRTIHL